MSGGWTPGRWIVVDDSDPEFVGMYDVWIEKNATEDGGEIVAACFREHAHLIAAAPALYEAVQWCVDHFDGNTRCNADQETNCIEKCRDALALARPSMEGEG